MARLLHKISEVDPLLCPRCGTEMKVIRVIVQPKVIDKILAHIRETGADRTTNLIPPRLPSHRARS